MARRRFTERQVIECLIRDGHEIRCHRTGEVITPETVALLEREHGTPLALGGEDTPENCFYSLKAAHSEQTNGKPHTSYGSDKHAIAKVKRLRGETCTRPSRPIPSRPFAKGQRKIASRPFQRAAT